MTIAAPGFINFRLSDEWLQRLPDLILESAGSFGSLDVSRGRAQVECVSANPTGPITLGRTRGGVIGDTLSEPVGLKAILAQLQEKFDVYFILPGDAGYGGSAKILGFWRKLLGQNVIALDDLDAVCETIALTVGLGEEAIDLAEGLDDLAQVGSAAGAAVGKALARLGSPSVVRAPAPAGLDESEPWDGLVRL